jgi:non-canonical (house-cleaning) NTP pyrophosphatase
MMEVMGAPALVAAVAEPVPLVWMVRDMLVGTVAPGYRVPLTGQPFGMREVAEVARNRTSHTEPVVPVSVVMGVELTKKPRLPAQLILVVAVAVPLVRL